jgi:hypothetical protein
MNQLTYPVWPGMNQIVQATDKASVLRCINLLRLAIAAQLQSLHRSVGRVATTHASKLNDVVGVESLTKSDASVILVDFDAEVEIEEAQIAHMEGGLHLGLEGLHLRFFCADDDEVIDVDAH